MNDLYDSGIIKRADFDLRSKYYGLKTKIFLIEPRHYAIQILSHHDLYDEMKVEFDRNIRPIATWIDLINEEPKTFKTKVEPLTNVAYKNEGIFLSTPMMESLLISRFPNIDITRIEVDFSEGCLLIVSVDNAISDSEIRELRNFILDQNNAFTDVEIKFFPAKPLLKTNELLACTDKNFEFSKQDSDFWFGNVDKIYSGKINRNSLRFFDSNKTKCFLDFSIWNNENINIRSTALLYDTIYLMPPLKNHLDNFFNQQHLRMADIEELAGRSKLVVLLPQSESRYDKNFLDCLYQSNHNSIVSQRGVNALLAIFFCELERKYLSSWKGYEYILRDVCKSCIHSPHEELRMLYEWLLWPIHAKNESFQLLTSHSPLKLPTIGVNKLFDKSLDSNENALFELTVNSVAIHLASALQSTYFPFAHSGEHGVYTDLSVSNILGDVINAFQYLESFQQQNLKAHSDLLNQERQGVYLLKPENSVSLKHVLDYADRWHTTTFLKRILEDLSKLDPDRQKQKIEEYNNLIAEAGKEKRSPDKFFNYSLTGATCLEDIAKCCAMIGLPIESGMFQSISMIGKMLGAFMAALRAYGLEEKFIFDRLNSDYRTVNDEVYILDKLSRVAKISY